MSRFVRFGGAAYVPGAFTLDGLAATYIDTPDVNKLDCDSSWFAQGTGGLWTVGTPSTDQATGQSSRSLKVLAGASTAITPVTDAAFFALKVYSASGDTFDINAGTPVVVGAGSWTEVKAAGNAGTYTVNAAGAADYYISEAIVQATDVPFVPSLRVKQNLLMETGVRFVDWSSADHTLLALRSGNFGYDMIQQSSGAVFSRYGDGVAQRGLSLNYDSVPVDGSQHSVRRTAVLGGDLNLWLDGVQQTQTNPISADEGAYNGQDLHVGANVGGNSGNVLGDLSSAIVRDGADGDGPIVARFFPDDYTGPAGAIPNLSTFTDSVTGREWTTHGGMSNTVVDFGDSVVVEGLTIPIQTFIVKDPVGMSDEIDGSRWVVGAGWVGDGYKATMHQGNDALGPIVAQFDAEDIGL